MSNFAVTAGRVKRKEPLSYKTRYNLNQKLKLRKIDELSSSSSENEASADTTAFECSSQIDNDEWLNEPPVWEISSISGSEISQVSGSTDEDKQEFSCGTFHHQMEQKLYGGCQLSLLQSVSLLQSLSSKHSLTQNAAEDILNLIKLHLPNNVNYPSSTYQFKKNLQIDPNWSQRIFYCKLCNVELNTTRSCPNCSEQYEVKSLIRDGYYFLSFNMRNQFHAILKHTDVQQSLLEKFHNIRDMNVLKGVESGSMYTRIGRNSNDLTCSVNVDGVPVFNSSKLSIWPVLVCINELPFHLRKRFVVIAGLWFGHGKPNMASFLKNIVELMNELHSEGVEWSTIHDIKITSRVWFVLWPVDTVARCMVQGHIQFNGKYGCTWCENPGKSIKKGLGHCRVYLLNSENVSLRTGFQYKERANSQNFVCGQKFRSPLCDLVGFNLVSGFSVDYMHCVFLGVVRSFTNKWVSEAGKEWYVGREITLIDSRILNTKVPKEIVRTPRTLNNIKYWKASEWRTWLFVLPVILKNILPKKYLKHFQLLSRAIFLCSKAQINIIELKESEDSLLKFLAAGEGLYGESFFSFNVHLLQHLFTTVKEWGPLWGSSAFQFESFNGKLLKYIKSANGVASQISEKFTLDMQLDSIDKLFSDSEAALMFYKKLTSASKLEIPKFGVLGCQKGIIIPSEVQDLIMSKFVVKELRAFKSAVIGRHEFRVKATRKRCNNIIFLGPNKFGKLQFIIQAHCLTDNQKECIKFLAVTHTYRVKAFKNVPHVYYCKENVPFELEVYELCQLKAKKYFEVTMMFKLYYIEVPNLFEID